MTRFHPLGRVMLMALVALGMTNVFAKGGAGGGGGGHASAGHSTAHTTGAAHAKPAHVSTPAPPARAPAPSVTPKNSGTTFPSWMFWRSSSQTQCSDERRKKGDC